MKTRWWLWNSSRIFLLSALTGKLENKKEKTCTHFDIISLHFIFVIIQLFLFPILSARVNRRQRNSVRISIRILNVTDQKKQVACRPGGLASYHKKQRDIISSLLFSGQCGMGMKVNCQTDSQDKLLTMVKSSMKVQVSIGEIYRQH